MRNPLNRWIFCLVAFCFAATSSLADYDEKAVRQDEELLKASKIATDGEGLLKFFRNNSLTPKQRLEVEVLIRQMGALSFRDREMATRKLIERGPVIIELLRSALENSDLEIVSRAEKVLQKIQENAPPPSIPAAAARLLRDRKPKQALEVLLDYMPYVANDSAAYEVRETLAALAVEEGKVNPVLVKALDSRTPIERATAAEALIRANNKEFQDKIGKLLADQEPLVRFRVAMAMVYGGEKKGVPIIIDLLPKLDQVQAWQAEDLLLRMTGELAPPTVSLGKKKEEKLQCQSAWQDWWKDNAGKVDLAKLSERPKLLGHTVIALLDEGKVLELGENNQIRWQINGLGFPLDIQVTPNKHLMVAEYHSSRVTERDFTGRIIWQRTVPGPLAVQRLRNGNTFIVTDSQLSEVDRGGNVVFTFSFPNERIMKAAKTRTGDIICLTDAARVVRLDEKGKEKKTFEIELGKRLFGGRLYTTSTGRILVPHNQENKVVEYDYNGKAVWQVNIEEPIAAVRLPNGNTLVTTMSQNRAVEFDRAGNEVWEYRTDTRVTRALRR